LNIYDEQLKDKKVKILHVMQNHDLCSIVLSSQILNLYGFLINKKKMTCLAACLGLTDRVTICFYCDI